MYRQSVTTIPALLTVIAMRKIGGVTQLNFLARVMKQGMPDTTRQAMVVMSKLEVGSKICKKNSFKAEPGKSAFLGRRIGNSTYFLVFGP